MRFCQSLNLESWQHSPFSKFLIGKKWLVTAASYRWHFIAYRSMLISFSQAGSILSLVSYSKSSLHGLHSINADNTRLTLCSTPSVILTYLPAKVTVPSLLQNREVYQSSIAWRHLRGAIRLSQEVSILVNYVLHYIDGTLGFCLLAF